MLQSLRALQEFFDIDIINPVPWHLKIKHRIVSRYADDGFEMYHPTYWYPPGIMRSHYGLFYYLSIRLCAQKLIKARRHDVVFSSWLYPDGWVACKIAASFGIPSIIMAIGTDANKLVKDSLIAKKTIETIAHSKNTLCVSEALKNKLVTIGADPSKLFVLYSGVDRNIFYKMDKAFVRKEMGYAPGDVLILFVGNLLKTKGLDELVDSFKKICTGNYFGNTKLIVAGYGKYESEFCNRLELSGVLNGTVLLGSCALPDVAKLMNAADVVCLPSYNEGLPNVVLEALCCNAKVVATEVGGIPEFVPRHENLYLVPPKNTEALSAALVKAIKAECAVDPAEDIGSWAEYARKLSEYL
jgi:glycosyltransferase involved in cell wall biosynthesis